MPECSYFRKESPELAREFDIPHATLHLSECGQWFSGVAADGDKNMEFRVVSRDKSVVYFGEVLVRQNSVLYFDRYPMGGGPFKISDFRDKDFRRRAALIAQNIESLLN